MDIAVRSGKVMSTIVDIAVSQDVSVAEEADGRAMFEKRRWPYFLTLSIMWLLIAYVAVKKAVYRLFNKSDPEINSLFFDGLGLSCRKIKEGATSWKALDVIYNHEFNKNHSIQNIVDDFWIGMMNAQAVRNRFKLAKQEIKRAVLQFSDQEEIRLISLACGSAQATIEAIAELKEKGIRVRAILIDADQLALDYATNLASRHRVVNQIDVRKADVYKVAKIVRDLKFKPHVVEMLGLLDYFSQKSAIKLMRKIHEILDNRGIFLTCNVCYNVEKSFLKWVINWDMLYRSPKELAEVAIEAGFESHRLIYEPLKIHGLLIAQKSGLNPG